MTQINNTYYLSDGLSKVIGAHTLKFGGQFHIDQVNEHPNATFNGTFNIDGTETGDPYADFLLGVPSNFTQSSGQPFYLRNRYFGALRTGQLASAQRPHHQRRPALGRDHALLGEVQPDPDLGPRSAVHALPRSASRAAGRRRSRNSEDARAHQLQNFAPRIGLAYAPRFDHGFLESIFGGGGKSSIRASYGIFYTEFPGLAAGIMYSVPPFGYNYLSPAPPLMATPFITAATGVNNGQRFPFPFPPHNVSASNPDTSVNWANFAPLSADPFFYYRNRAPYINNYMFSIQRQITPSTLLTVSYVGNQGHHILAVASVNLGNPALCLSLPGCGPFGEDSTYTNAPGRPSMEPAPDKTASEHPWHQAKTTAKIPPTVRRQLQLQRA